MKKSTLESSAKSILLEEKKIALAELQKSPARAIVKLFADPDWGDMKDRARVRGSDLEVVDTYYTGGKDTLNKLITEWTTPQGWAAKYFQTEYGVTFSVVSSSISMKYMSGPFKKLTGDNLGLVSLILKVSVA